MLNMKNNHIKLSTLFILVSYCFMIRPIDAKETSGPIAGVMINRQKAVPLYIMKMRGQEDDNKAMLAGSHYHENNSESENDETNISESNIQQNPFDKNSRNNLNNSYIPQKLINQFIQKNAMWTAILTTIENFPIEHYDEEKMMIATKWFKIENSKNERQIIIFVVAIQDENNEISLDCDVSVYDRRSETKEKSEITKNSKSFFKSTSSFTTKNLKESKQIKNIIMTKFHEALKKQKQ